MIRFNWFDLNNFTLDFRFGWKLLLNDYLRSQYQLVLLFYIHDGLVAELLLNIVVMLIIKLIVIVLFRLVAEYYYLVVIVVVVAITVVVVVIVVD